MFKECFKNIMKWLMLMLLNKETENATRNSEKQIQSFNRNFMSTWSVQSNTATLVKRKCVLHRLEGKVSSFSLFFYLTSFPPFFFSFKYFSFYGIFKTKFLYGFVLSFCFLRVPCQVFRIYGGNQASPQSRAQKKTLVKFATNWGQVKPIGDLIPLVS